MKNFKGRVAAVTGAGSGIGRALALGLASEGAELAVSDVNEAALAETVSLCEQRGAKTSSRTLDVSSREDVCAWADDIVAEHGRVNVIANNAGVSLGSTLEAMSWEDLKWSIDINLWGVLHGTKGFLPHLIASGDGHIINVSSSFGLISLPGQSAYNAAKFGVRGFTNAVRMELEIARHPVSTTLVYPSNIRTNIIMNMRANESAGPIANDREGVHNAFQKSAKTSPDQAAQAILQAVRKNRRGVLIGEGARFEDLMSRLPDAIHQTRQVRKARRYSA